MIGFIKSIFKKKNYKEKQSALIVEGMDAIHLMDSDSIKELCDYGNSYREMKIRNESPVHFSCRCTRLLSPRKLALDEAGKIFDILGIRFSMTWERNGFVHFRTNRKLNQAQKDKVSSVLPVICRAKFYDFRGVLM